MFSTQPAASDESTVVVFFSSFKVGRPGSDSPTVVLFFCVFLVHVCTSRTVKVSSFPLSWPFDGMEESGRGGEGLFIIFTPVLCDTRSKVEPMETNIPGADGVSLEENKKQLCRAWLCCYYLKKKKKSYERPGYGNS